MGRDSDDDRSPRRRSNTSEKSEQRKERKYRKRDSSRSPERDDRSNRSSSSGNYNPWGSQLSEKFQWKAKEERDRERGTVPAKDNEDMERRRRDEIEKVKKARFERESAKRRWEEEKETKQRQKEMDAGKDWEKQEEEFLIKQNKLRSEIRITEGRAKPIDIVYKNIVKDAQFEVDTRPPHKIFKGMSVDELRELTRDLQMFSEIDTNNPEFWDALKFLCNYYTDKRIAQTRGNEGMHSAVAAEVKALFSSKTAAELDTLRDQIEDKLQGGGGIDVEYWENLHFRAGIYKAKAILKEAHKKLIDDPNLKKKAYSTTDYAQPRPATTKYEPEEYTESTPSNSIEARRKQLEIEAQMLKEKHATKVADKPLTDEEMYRREAESGMGEGEEVFNEEYALNDTYTWAAKVKPQRPKCFNRVQLGVDWNKYNQTHYDIDNPPPKIVFGYKFNIFYPNFVNSRQTPTYFIERCDNPDFQVLRFHAGAPYEDIAFKIPNKEWDYSHKAGFKSVFERGILHLWFQYKRYKYRR